MTSVAIVWFRRDLRVHDNPPLHAALAGHDRVVPAFVVDPALVRGRFASPSRTAFLYACLRDLDASLRERGAALVVREGSPGHELAALAEETGASAVYFASDVSPYARKRDRRIENAELVARPAPGNFVADVNAIRTRAGTPFGVFSPFHRAWLAAERRTVHRAPAEIPMPSGVRHGPIPSGAADFEIEPGETAARASLERWLRSGLVHYDERHDVLAGGTSGLSPYLRFGCLSPREVEERVARRTDAGAEAFRRQLAWRDFYAHVLLHNPANARREHQERYRSLAWDDDRELLDAWREGRTGFPLVDAGMRQLRATGWMHNRARLVVGSFLTKDLHLDWREGEAHFMRHLLDGDVANNNGNWQWIASVGVDPAPLHRRLYNPARHQERYDPDGEYVRRWVPELRDVPPNRLAEPWRMTEEQQEAAGCVIGRDYPEPVVDHARERRRAIARDRAAADR